MKTYTIHVHKTDSIYDEYRYCAVFSDYHGTPLDKDTPSPDPIGYGDTKYEVMYDLMRKAL